MCIFFIQTTKAPWQIQSSFCGLGRVLQKTLGRSLFLFCFCFLFFLLQDHLTAAPGLAAAEPVWPVWAEDRAATQSPPPSSLRNRGQPRGRQSVFRRAPRCQGIHLSNPRLFLCRVYRSVNQLVKLYFCINPRALMFLPTQGLTVCGNTIATLH